jgi:naphthalene 1,2-dioxygenase ferredoxin component
MTWLSLIETDFVSENDVVGSDRADGSFAVFQVDGTIYVTDNLCTHGNARLCDGFLEGFEIECPMHQGRFDIRTGTPLCAPLVQPLACYPVKIENGFVCIDRKK